MADGVHDRVAKLLPAPEFASTLPLRNSTNGLRYAYFGEAKVSSSDLDRIVQAVPVAIAPALANRAFYFVPLALPEPGPEPSSPRIEAHHAHSEATLIAPVFTSDLAEEAVCHRNVSLPDSPLAPAHEGVFISAGLLHDKFALAFEFFINVGHAFTESFESAAAEIPEAFAALAWSQALAEVRGETSQDAFEARTQALSARPAHDEKAKLDFLEGAFADALAIYLLSLAVDFDYSELREREYPLLAPSALAERLRVIARLYPPNSGYEFSVRYRRRA